MNIWLTPVRVSSLIPPCWSEVVKLHTRLQVLNTACRNPYIQATQIHCCFLFGQSFPHGELLFVLAAGGFWGTGPQLCSPLCVLLLWYFLPTFFLCVSESWCSAVWNIRKRYGDSGTTNWNPSLFYIWVWIFWSFFGHFLWWHVKNVGQILY